MTVAVTITGGQQPSGQALGVMLLTTGNVLPSTDGWVIVSDPSGTAFNWNQMTAWSSPHTFTWTVKAPMTVGTHAMNIWTLHGGGDKYAKQAQMSVTVTAATTPPSVTINQPISGRTLSGVTNVIATISPGSSPVTSATLVMGGQTFSSPSIVGTTYTWTVDTKLMPNGATTAVVTAVSAAGTGTTTTSGLVVSNIAPTIVITAPAAGDILGGIAWVNATITPGTVGTSIISATIKVDTTLVLASWSSPYSYQLNTRPFTDGAHDIMVTATDSNGNTVTALQRVNFDNLAPQVTIVSPLNGQVVTGMSIITTTVTDASPIRWVSFWIDSTQIANLTAAPYTATWNTASYAPGSHVVKVMVSDMANNTHATTAPVTVDNTGPMVDITAPSNGAVVTGTISVSAMAVARHGSTVSSVQLLVDGTLQSTLTVAPYTFTYNTAPLADGPHTILVRAIDAAGNSGTQTITVIANNSGTAATPPQVIITSPLNGQTGSGTENVTATVTATAPATLVSVSLYVDNGLVGTLSAAPFTWTVDTTLYTDTVHTINVTALDSFGRTGFMAIMVFINNAPAPPPSVTITSPPNGGTVTGSFHINATVISQINIDEVQIRVDGVLVSALATAPYSYQADSNLWTDGRHTINVTAIDARLQRGSIEIPIIVNNALPLVQIMAPLNGTAVFGTVTVNATVTGPYAINSMQFFVDNALVAALTTSPYLFSMDTFAYTDGTHTLRVMANDAGGRSSNASIVIIIANGPPSVRIINPTDGANVSRTMQVSADIVSSAGIRYVMVLVDDRVFVNSTVQNYFWPINTGVLTDGPHLVVVRAFDLLGRVAENSVHVTVSNPIPSVTVGGVTPGSNVTGVITISGTARPLSEIAYVTIAINGVLLENRTAPPFYFSLDTRGYADGPATLVVTAYTFAGKSNSTAVSFTIKNPVPLPDMSQWAATMLAGAFGSVAVMALLVGGVLAYRRQKRLGRLRKW